MTELTPGTQFLLLRVEATHGAARSVPIRSYATLDEAIAAAAEQPLQPRAKWEPGRVDGVWREIDRAGQGFVVHRIDEPTG